MSVHQHVKLESSIFVGLTCMILALWPLYKRACQPCVCLKVAEILTKMAMVAETTASSAHPRLISAARPQEAATTFAITAPISHKS